MKGAVVALSGGQDSATCLFWAIEKFGRDKVHAISFDYGQRHRIELDLAADLARAAEIPWRLYLVPALAQMGAASLTNANIANVGEGVERNEYAEARGLPPSFVPGRNALFFSIAAAHCAIFGLPTLVTGVCQQDHSGYPDCREVFVAQMEYALQLALDLHEFTIAAPLLNRSKAETWALAEALGVLDVIIEQTNTCYEGDRTTRHGYGFGCGECGACVERAKGWHEFKATRDAAGVTT